MWLRVRCTWRGIGDKQVISPDPGLWLCHVGFQPFFFCWVIPPSGKRMCLDSEGRGLHAANFCLSAPCPECSFLSKDNSSVSLFLHVPTWVVVVAMKKLALGVWSLQLMDREWIFLFFPLHCPVVCPGLECCAPGILSFCLCFAPSKQLLIPFRNSTLWSRREILEKRGSLTEHLLCLLLPLGGKMQPLPTPGHWACNCSAFVTPVLCRPVYLNVATLIKRVLKLLYRMNWTKVC